VAETELRHIRFPAVTTAYLFLRISTRAISSKMMAEMTANQLMKSRRSKLLLSRNQLEKTHLTTNQMKRLGLMPEMGWRTPLISTTAWTTLKSTGKHWMMCNAFFSNAWKGGI
jgi:hypothetical protein